jgi:NADH:ubiquinone oxidoreductase subunit B-like Fe-S oxidoreductase
MIVAKLLILVLFTSPLIEAIYYVYEYHKDPKYIVECEGSCYVSRGLYYTEKVSVFI